MRVKMDVYDYFIISSFAKPIWLLRCWVKDSSCKAFPWIFLLLEGYAAIRRPFQKTTKAVYSPVKEVVNEQVANPNKQEKNQCILQKISYHLFCLVWFNSDLPFYRFKRH
jgi:hypothetical protein